MTIEVMRAVERRSKATCEMDRALMARVTGHDKTMNYLAFSLTVLWKDG